MVHQKAGAISWLTAGLLAATLAAPVASWSGNLTTTTTTLAEPPDPCGDPVGIGTITALDALFVLRSAVHTQSCQHCSCDVKGNDGITASDSLAVLRAAVGLDVELLCPPCSLELASSSGCVELPEGSSVDLSDLQVVASLGASAVEDDCTFDLPAFAGSQLGVVLTGSGQPMMLGWLEPSGSQINAHSTAEVLLYFALGGFTLAPNLQPQLVELIAEAPELAMVEAAVAEALAGNPEALIDGDAAVIATLQAAVDSIAARAGEEANIVADAARRRPRNVLVNPGGGSSGVTPVQGGVTVSLMNEFRRPAYAYLERVSHKFSFGGDIPSPQPLTDFAIPATSGVTSASEAALDAALVIFGIQDGKPLAYAPITTDPVVLPLFPKSKSTRYRLLVVGPGAGAGALAQLSQAQLAKQQDLTVKFVLKDLLLPAVLNILIPKSSINDLVQIEDFDDLAKDMVVLATTAVPAIAEKSGQGDIKGALAAAWEFVSTSDSFRDLILTGVSEAIVHFKDYDTQYAALNNARTLLRALEAVDIAITSFDLGAIGKSILESNMADAWTLDVIAPTLSLTPPYSQLGLFDEQELTVHVLDPDPGAAYTYRWSNTAGQGDLLDNQGNPDNDFETSHDVVTYRPRLDATTGTDTITVEVFQIDGHSRLSVGEVETYVGVQPPTLLLLPRKVSLGHNETKQFGLKFQPEWTGGPLLYHWTMTQNYGQATGVLGTDTAAETISYEADASGEGIDTATVQAVTMVDDQRVVVGQASGQIRVENQASIVFGELLIDTIFSGTEEDPRVAVAAVVSVPEQEGAIEYRLRAYGGNDPAYYGTHISADGPPFSQDFSPNRPEGMHWYGLAGGNGPAANAEIAQEYYFTRFDTGWIWEIEIIR